MLRKQIRMAIALGVLGIIGLAFSFPALLRIAHGEADTRMEWATVRATTAVLLIFIAQSLFTLVKVSKVIPKK